MILIVTKSTGLPNMRLKGAIGMELVSGPSRFRKQVIFFIGFSCSNLKGFEILSFNFQTFVDLTLIG